MEVVHICLNSPYTDNWGYQENIIPKYHKKFGNNVTVIASNEIYSDKGEIIKTDTGSYLLNDGVRVIRIKKNNKLLFDKFTRTFKPYDIYDLLCSIKPDFIMIHGLIGSISALQVLKYIKRKNSKCVVLADIHEDHYNTPIGNNLLRRILIPIHRYLNKKMYKYYKKVIYVAGSCKEYAKDYYKVPEEMLELLPLGCDVELIDRTNRLEIRKNIRTQYGLNDDDIIVCHGGKLNEKKNTVELIRAIKRIHKENSKVKLIIFGSLTDAYKQIIDKELENSGDFIKYAGMLAQKQYHDILLASDIAVFPGGQSVLWQQSIACGLATLVRRHIAIEYLDLGGNILFLEEGNENEIYEQLKEIIFSNEYIKMKKVAEEKGFDFFSYERISKRLLSFVDGNQNDN